MCGAPSSLTTERLVLRPFEPADVEPYAAIWSKPEVVRHLPGGEALAARARERAERGVDAMAALWRDPDGLGYGPWAAVERETGRLLGHMGLRHLPDLGGETEILYMLDTPAWGRGLATEGARAARDYGFDRLGLPRLIAMALPANAASLRVMEKIGMTREPGLIEAFGVRGVRYAMGASDPRV